jgi:soluble P-type ATPase
MIEIVIPGATTLRLSAAIFDFNGTLARDGRLCDGVADRIRMLAQRLAIHVATADTTQTARAELADLPVTVHSHARGRSARARNARFSKPATRARPSRSAMAATMRY